MPPLLARFGVARLENDVKGCTLGVREIDPQVEVFERFGACIERTADSLIVRAGTQTIANHHWRTSALRGKFALRGRKRGMDQQRVTVQGTQRRVGTIACTDPRRALSAALRFCVRISIEHSLTP